MTLASVQRIALYVLFDSIENDLVERLRSIPSDSLILSSDELQKAKSVLSRKHGGLLNTDDPFDLVYGLDIGQKYDIILRNKSSFDASYISYLKSVQENIQNALPVRNAIMHGRPLTIDEYSSGFAFAQDLIRRAGYWPILARSYSKYNQNPESLVAASLNFLDEPAEFGVLNNLPLPDYEDTGFLKRPFLEEELKRRILGRYPVITVQGDGGNGKTALTLQTVWNLVESDDHDFDLILWYSAKTASLTEKGVQEIKSSFVESLSIVNEIATYTGSSDDPFEALNKVLTDNKILLIIDNLETVSGPFIEKLVMNVPGASKLVLTSRVPATGDLPLAIPEFTEAESVRYLRTLISAHSLKSLAKASNEELRGYASKLGRKPLLIKWFALGVKSGALPASIVADPKVAIKFCLENVMNRLGNNTLVVVNVLASISDSLSPSVVGSISELSPQYVEDSISELNRYGLVEFTDLANSERVFRLRPFVRTYVVRIISPERDTLNQYLKLYHKIQGHFQSSRASAKFNKYEPTNLIVRTNGEAVAADTIRKLSKLLYKGRREEVEEGIQRLKISDPGYFEIYRFEGFAAHTWSDVPRAIDAYEAALEYGSDQSQLLFFFGGMLARNGYTDQSSRQFQKALALDPNASPVLREAARSEMRSANFEVSEEYLKRADSLSGHSMKESLLITDLWIQLYQRTIDYYVRNSAHKIAEIHCGKFLDYLNSADIRLFDKTIIDHLLKIEPYLRILLAENRILVPHAQKLRLWIDHEILSNNNYDITDGKFLGQLKVRGRRETFGFLLDNNGREFFLSAASTEPSVWKWLENDGPVEFSVRTRIDGKEEAFNVSKVDRAAVTT